jgi:phenylacetate-CoA ligase
MSGIKTLLKKMPEPVQAYARYAYSVIPLSVRYGKTYQRMSSFLSKSQWWTKEQLEAYQIEKLSKLLAHSYANVPYYRKVFNERNLKPGDIKNLDDLRLLPLLTRDIIRENFSDLVARNFPESKLQRVTTGGSTGIPLGLAYERETTDQLEQAFIHALWQRVGFTQNDKSALFKGKLIRSGGWHYDPMLKNLNFSTFHMNDEMLARYFQKLKQYKPDFIVGFPSTLSVLANFMLQNKIEPISGVKAVLCGSENLFSGIRQLLSEAFACRIFSWYGHTERVVLAGECEAEERYHIFPEYGIVELVGEDNIVINEPEKTGEIIGTSLNNFIFPLIRYRTADIASYSGDTCSCGRAYPLFERVDGRTLEYVVTRDNHKITLSAFIQGHYKAFSRVKQLQIIQNRPGDIKIKIAGSTEFSKTDEDELKAAMLARAEGRIDIEFDYVDEIERTKSGKHRFLIQQIPTHVENANA